MEETGSKNEAIGLYRHPESGATLGALDSASANAFVQVGFKLVEEGREAAMRPDPNAPQAPDDDDDDEPDTTQSNARGGR